MSGVVDPESIYTKQNCIGKPQETPLALNILLTLTGGGSFGKVFKGFVFLPLSETLIKTR